MGIESTSGVIDNVKQGIEDARKAEQEAMSDCEHLNAQIEIVRANSTEEITKSVETTIKSIDKSLREGVSEKVEQPTNKVKNEATEASKETTSEMNKEQEAMSALEGISTKTIDVSSEISETKGKITETIQTRKEQIVTLDKATQEATEIINSASRITLN